MESVLYINKEFAGLVMAFMAAVFIRGTSIPLFVESNSSIAVALGLLVPIPTLSWACTHKFKCMQTKVKHAIKILFENIKCFMKQILRFNSSALTFSG